MTRTVETKVTTVTGRMMVRSCPQAVMSPTPAGMNMSGIASIRNCEVSSTLSSFIIPVISAIIMSARP